MRNRSFIFFLARATTITFKYNRCWKLIRYEFKEPHSAIEFIFHWHILLFTPTT